MSQPRILFLADAQPDYVADGLFHGLRTLLGAGVVDFPRRDAMYHQADLSASYGKGFGLYGLLPDIPVDRDNVFQRDWDLVISAVIWRDWQWWERAWATFGTGVRHAVIDGGDLPWIYPYGPAWWRPQRWFVPRTRGRAVYFKREWRAFSMLAAGRRLPLEPFGIAYPAEKIVGAVPAKTQDFQSHIVDLEVGERLGRRLAHDRVYIFDSEPEYLADLRASRYGITTKRAGWDALRHLDIAGAGAVPCFRDLDRKPVTCAPHGLIPGRNCVSYRNADDLMRTVASIRDGDRLQMAEAAIDWARANTTVVRARHLLEKAL